MVNICWITENPKEFQKNIYFCFIHDPKAFDCVDHNKLWKIFQEMGIPDHLTCLLRNLYAGQEATESDMEKRTGSKLGKEYIKAVCCHPAYLTSMQSISWEILGWMKQRWFFFFESLCFFSDSVDVGNLISDFSAFSKSSLYIWKFSVHVLLKVSLKGFWALPCSHLKWVQLYCSLSILWRCLSLGLEWKLTFSSPVAMAEFPEFAGILSSVFWQLQ